MKTTPEQIETLENSLAYVCELENDYTFKYPGVYKTKRLTEIRKTLAELRSIIKENKMNNVDYDKMDMMALADAIQNRWPGLPKWQLGTLIDWLDREVVPRLRTAGVCKVEWWKQGLGQVIIQSRSCRSCERTDKPLAWRLAVLILTGDYTVEEVNKTPDPTQTKPPPKPDYLIHEITHKLDPPQDTVMDRNVFRRMLMTYGLHVADATKRVNDVEATEAAETQVKENS